MPTLERDAASALQGALPTIDRELDAGRAQSTMDTLLQPLQPKQPPSVSARLAPHAPSSPFPPSSLATPSPSAMPTTPSAVAAPGAESSPVAPVAHALPASPFLDQGMSLAPTPVAEGQEQAMDLGQSPPTLGHATSQDQSLRPTSLPRLFFCGEHTSIRAAQCVHGACLSGERAGREVAAAALSQEGTSGALVSALRGGTYSKWLEWIPLPPAEGFTPEWDPDVAADRAMQDPGLSPFEDSAEQWASVVARGQTVRACPECAPNPWDRS